MRCPICQADNDQGPQCRRCRADLSLLWTLEKQRRQAVREAYQTLVAGQLGESLALASYADDLRRDEESGRLLALAHLLRRDFVTAWQSHRSRFLFQPSNPLR
jgi:hypothetical protein